MSRTRIWSVLVFTAFAFAPATVIVWIRDGPLREAGASMDNLPSDPGNGISETTGEIVDSTGTTLQRVRDGDDRTWAVNSGRI
jgi:hypothetical protein